MAQPRKHQINLESTRYYHCYVRCVRKGYLFGRGENNKNYDHRKSWVVERMRHLCRYFALEVCAYAIMSNHYHLVLHVNKEKAESWSEEEVNARWRGVLHQGLEGLSPSEEEVLRRRSNLYSISWFMRFLNEYIARLANREDEVTGRFWEGRFQSQALLDEGALLACMAYVDLNPIRAKLSRDLEESSYTSIQARLKAYAEGKEAWEMLSVFSDTGGEVTLPFTQGDYVRLVDWTGRQYREAKGFIASAVPCVVEAVGLNPSYWLKTVNQSSTRAQTISGSLEHIQAWARRIKQSWLKGQRLSRHKYLNTSP